jgi:hypothetical protein
MTVPSIRSGNESVVWLGRDGEVIGVAQRAHQGYATALKITIEIVGKRDQRTFEVLPAGGSWH